MSPFLQIVILVVLALALAGVIVAWRQVHLRERGRVRLVGTDQPAAADQPETPPARSFVRRWTWVAAVVAVLVGAGLYFLAGFPVRFAGTIALVVGLLGWQLESFRVARIMARIEEQLADALDLMVATLRVGTGVLGALETATLESRPPLRTQLDEVLGRVRYGDDPQAVLRGLEARVPLETFRLFAAALSVHWETGGSLAPTLASVGRVIRDRIEIGRRVHALTTQARLSTVAILLLTYFLVLVVWRNDPERMRQFLATSIGQTLAAGAILLQAVGLVWASAMSRLRY